MDAPWPNQSDHWQVSYTRTKGKTRRSCFFLKLWNWWFKLLRNLWWCKIDKKCKKNAKNYVFWKNQLKLPIWKINYFQKTFFFCFVLHKMAQLCANNELFHKYFMVILKLLIHCYFLTLTKWHTVWQVWTYYMFSTVGENIWIQTPRAGPSRVFGPNFELIN